MTEFDDFKPFFNAMIAKMKQHDHTKGDSWRDSRRFVAHNLRSKLWEEFRECIEYNSIEKISSPNEFVDLANICAMIWLRISSETKEVS